MSKEIIGVNEKNESIVQKFIGYLYSKPLGYSLFGETLSYDYPCFSVEYNKEIITDKKSMKIEFLDSINPSLKKVLKNLAITKKPKNIEKKVEELKTALENY